MPKHSPPCLIHNIAHLALNNLTSGYRKRYFLLRIYSIGYLFWFTQYMNMTLIVNQLTDLLRYEVYPHTDSKPLAVPNPVGKRLWIGKKKIKSSFPRIKPSEASYFRPSRPLQDAHDWSILALNLPGKFFHKEIVSVFYCSLNFDPEEWIF